MFCLPEPNYTNSQGNSVWWMAAPRGLGRLGPTKKCTVMVKMPPRPGGQGKMKISGKEEWRPRQTAGSAGNKRCPREGIVGGGGRGVQPDSGPTWWAPEFGGGKQPPPAPAACLLQPKYQLAEEEES